MKRILLFINIVLLLASFTAFSQANQAAIDKSIGQAETAINEVEQGGNWVEQFASDGLMELPIGIKTGKENALYSVVITKATFYSDYATVTVFCRVDIPQGASTGGGKTTRSIYFGADDIKISKNGGIIGDGKLTLLGDVDVELGKNWGLSLYGGFDMKTGTVRNQTYAVIDCDGFKEMKVTGAVHFSDKMIKRIDPNSGNLVAGDTRSYEHPLLGTRTMPNRVKGDFSFTVQSWNDILVKVSLEPFVLAEMQNGKDYNSNFQFRVNNAILDMSDTRNDIAMVFPSAYRENNLLFPSEEAWRGVYIESLAVSLPSEFKTKGHANNRVEVGAKNLLIDKYGVSGALYAKNVFTLDQGTTSNNAAWAYSLDYLEAHFVTNKLVGGALGGQILLPISNGKDAESAQRKALRYKGIITKTAYNLQVTTESDIDFDIWQAKAKLLAGSSVELKVAEGKFLPKANLHGKVSFSLKEKGESENSDKKALVAFDNISFQNLQLQTVSPMIAVDYMGTEGALKFNNFPVSISDIHVRMSDAKASLNFKIGLNLMESSQFTAAGGFSIIGSLGSEDVVQKWRFEKVAINHIAVNGSFSGLKVEGELDIRRDDPIYGDGFQARLMVEFPLVGFKVESKAIMGRTDFRYWYFDASVDFPGAFITGFGGGAYYQMQRKAGLDPTEFSPSGSAYMPNKDIGLGVKAMVKFGFASVVDAQASFEMAFTKSGGVAFLGIYGRGKVLSNIPGAEKIANAISQVKESTSYFDNSEHKDILEVVGLNSGKGQPNSPPATKMIAHAEEQLPMNKGAGLSFDMQVGIEFDFLNNSVFGCFKAMLDVPGDVISGTGPGGSIGYAEFYKGPKEWHLYMGTPDSKVGVKIGVAGMFIKTGSYFMTGTSLPASPPPPAQVARILGVDVKELDYMRDENQLANGGGMAFGSSLEIDTGDLNFLIMYARFMAGLGFDIMLKDYGDASCVNTSSDVLGINGWYANGQSYAYLQGELGVRIKLWFIKMKVPIITAGAATLMQAKLPNPFWARGYVGGHMNVLGGLIKGKFRFKFTIGKECEFANTGVLGGMKMITDLTPKDNTDEVDVFVAPQVTFSMKVNEPIVIPEDSGDNTYKIQLEKFRLVDENGIEVPSKIEWGQLKDRATLIPEDILGSKKRYKIEVEVSFYKLENGVFVSVKENGAEAREYEERSFVSGEAPDHIPLHNIKYAYPVVDQKYFHIKEYPQGYVQLKQGQDYLFESGEWDTNVKIVDKENQEVLEASFNYHNSSNEITYELPKKIKLDKTYNFRVISKNKLGKDVKSSNRTQDKNVVDEDGNEISVKENIADDVIQEGEIDRLSYAFGTSKYKTFVDKMNKIKTTSYNFGIVYSDVISLENAISSAEPFDIPELTGTTYTDNTPLMQPEAVLDDRYFKEDIYPYLYENYPIEGRYEVTYRDVEDYGIIPKKAIFIRSYYLMSADYQVNKNWMTSYFPYTYNLGQVYKEDWVNLTNLMVNDEIDRPIDPNAAFYKILRKHFEFMRYGDYKIKLNYRLPGGKKESDFIYKYQNPNKFRL